jgi:hypothetical protein
MQKAVDRSSKEPWSPVSPTSYLRSRPGLKLCKRGYIPYLDSTRPRDEVTGMELHDELFRGPDITGCIRVLPLALPLCSLGDCIDLDINPRNLEIEPRRYHTFIVGNERTHAAVPDTTITPELSVTVGH